MDTREIQTRLKALGYFLGTSGPAKDDVDGDFAALLRAMTRTDPVQRPTMVAAAAELRGLRRQRERALRVS